MVGGARLDETGSRRAAVVCRHPATARRMQQALAMAGLGFRQAPAPSVLPRSQRGEFAAVLLDLDVDPDAEPAALAAAVDEACPDTPVFATARSRKRLLAALAAPNVAGLLPKIADAIDDAQKLPDSPSPEFADGPDEQELGTALKRLLARASIPPGPAPYLLHGTLIDEKLVGSSEEREAVLAELLEFADRFGFADEKLRRIETAADELTANAVYHAPRDDQGRARFAALDRRAPVTLPAQDQVRVRFGCDGRSFALSVSDRFGSLARAAACAAFAQIDGGEPRGLALSLAASNQLAVHCAPGRFTEITAVSIVAGSHRAAQSRGSALHLFYL